MFYEGIECVSVLRLGTERIKAGHVMEERVGGMLLPRQIETGSQRNPVAFW